MANFGKQTMTNVGRALQAKVQAGTPLIFTRMAVGDGNLGSNLIPNLTGLISPKKSLAIKRLRAQSGGKTLVGSVLSNQDVTTGFYFREWGLFAQDPDAGEILYCYANSGAGAEYIAPGGGAEVIEKNTNILVQTANASNVTAEIVSGVYALASDVGDMATVPTEAKDAAGAISELYEMIEEFNPVPPDGSITDAMIGNRTISDADAPTGNTAAPTTLWSWLAYMIKAITGKSSWRTAPATTLEAAKTHMDATTGVHGATSAATANRIIIRDAAGRAKVAAPAASDDIARRAEIESPPLVTTTGTGLAYVATFNPPYTSLVAGTRITVKFHTNNAGASTINVNGLGAKLLKKSDGSNMAAGDLLATGVYTFVYDGTNFILQGEGGGGVPWLEDLSAYTQHYNISRDAPITAPPVNTWVNRLDVSGEGFLQWVQSGTRGGDNPLIYLRITIDGVSTIINTANNAMVDALYGINFFGPVYFKQSLKLDVMVLSSAFFTPYCDYLYFLKTGTPNKNTRSVLQQSNLMRNVLKVQSDTYVDLVNVTGAGYFLNADFYNFRDSSGRIERVIVRITIDNAIKFDTISFDASGPSYRENKFYGPIRFTSSLRIQIRTLTPPNGTAQASALYTLD